MQDTADNGIKVNLTDNNILQQTSAMDPQCSDEDSPLFLHSDDKRQPLHLAVVGGISVLIAASLFLAASILFVCTGGEIPFDYGIVIDAGSTHTEVFLYRWLGSKDHGTGDVLQVNSSTYDSGISTLYDPTVIVQCVKDVVEFIPSGSRVHSPLYLGATAGMRLLNMTKPKETRMILLALKCALQKALVDVETVDMIEGHDEGMFSWVSTNFLEKTLHPKQNINPWNNTYGALDLGGASTQLAYAINPDSSENGSETDSIKLYGHTYSIISKSFLCFGLAQAFVRHQALLIEDFNSTEPIYDPCLPKGNVSTSKAESLLNQPCTQTPNFTKWLSEEDHKNKKFTFQGGSDFKKCRKSVANLLDASTCQNTGFQKCPERVNISHNDAKFMAFSSFYYVTEFLKSSNVSLEDFIDNTEKWCSLTWKEIDKQKHKKSDLSHITKYCFGGLYVIQWLTKIYGFDNTTWKNITFQQQIGNSDVGWSLGYMINATNAIPEERPSPPVISSVVYSILVVFSICLITFGIVFLFKYYKNRHRYSELNHSRLID